MRPLEPSDILDLTAYEKIREDFLEKTIALKRPRRIQVGDRLCFVFENRDTVRFQVQEMTRAERTVKEEAIAEEVAVYNELIPGENELSATLMIEIPEMDRIRGELDGLIGIDEHVFLDVGDESVRAQRFAAIVEDGVVKKLAVEKPMAFEVSDADSILAAL